MSKKDKKIKKLKQEVKELKAELRKLKSSSRKRTTVAKAPKPPRRPKPQAAPERTDIDTPAEIAATLESISAVRGAG